MADTKTAALLELNSLLSLARADSDLNKGLPELSLVGEALFPPSENGLFIVCFLKGESVCVTAAAIISGDLHKALHGPSLDGEILLLLSENGIFIAFFLKGESVCVTAAAVLSKELLLVQDKPPSDDEVLCFIGDPMRFEDDDLEKGDWFGLLPFVASSRLLFWLEFLSNFIPALPPSLASTIKPRRSLPPF